MKSARYALSRHLPVFFETELRGVYRFDEITVLPPEDAPRPEGMSPLRRPPYGKYRELVSARFGSYDLEVYSPNERPPLGEVVLKYPDGEISGPLDQVTWQRLGTFIRNREPRKTHAA